MTKMAVENLDYAEVGHNKLICSLPKGRLWELLKRDLSIYKAIQSKYLMVIIIKILLKFGGDVET